MEYSYDSNFDPPAPILEISVSTPISEEPQIKLKALIDSGADLTAIPQQIIDRLQLYPVDEINVSDYEGKVLPKTLYTVSLYITNFKPKIIRVVSTEEDLIFLGRDVINNWELLLDGRKEIFDIS